MNSITDGKREAIKETLREQHRKEPSKRLSLRAIGRAHKVTAKTVGKIRDNLIAAGELAEAAKGGGE